MGTLYIDNIVASNTNISMTGAIDNTTLGSNVSIQSNSFNINTLGKLGSRENPALSAWHILSSENSVSTGFYYIKDQINNKVYHLLCDMERNGGGWMMVANQPGDRGVTTTRFMNSSSIGPGLLPYESGGKLSDSTINILRNQSSYTDNWPWWAEGVMFTTTNTDVDMFIYKDATSWSSLSYPGYQPGTQYFINGSYAPDWRKIKNSFTTHTATDYSDVGAPNQGTRGFGHHHINTSRFAWCRHPESTGSDGFRSDSLGNAREGYFWVR